LNNISNKKIDGEALKNSVSVLSKPYKSTKKQFNSTNSLKKYENKITGNVNGNVNCINSIAISEEELKRNYIRLKTCKNIPSKKQLDNETKPFNILRDNKEVKDDNDYNAYNDYNDDKDYENIDSKNNNIDKANNQEDIKSIDCINKEDSSENKVLSYITNLNNLLLKQNERTITNNINYNLFGDNAIKIKNLDNQLNINKAPSSQSNKLSSINNNSDINRISQINQLNQLNQFTSTSSNSHIPNIDKENITNDIYLSSENRVKRYNILFNFINENLKDINTIFTQSITNNKNIMDTDSTKIKTDTNDVYGISNGDNGNNGNNEFYGLNDKNNDGLSFFKDRSMDKIDEITSILTLFNTTKTKIVSNKETLKGNNNYNNYNLSNSIHQSEYYDNDKSNFLTMMQNDKEYKEIGNFNNANRANNKYFVSPIFMKNQYDYSNLGLNSAFEDRENLNELNNINIINNINNIDNNITNFNNINDNNNEKTCKIDYEYYSEQNTVNNEDLDITIEEKLFVKKNGKNVYDNKANNKKVNGYKSNNDKDYNIHFKIALKNQNNEYKKNAFNEFTKQNVNKAEQTNYFSENVIKSNLIEDDNKDKLNSKQINKDFEKDKQNSKCLIY